jgi:hypothetical protein
MCRYMSQYSPSVLYPEVRSCVAILAWTSLRILFWTTSLHLGTVRIAVSDEAEKN